VTQVFAEEELERLRGFPEIGRDELFRFFTLAPADVAFVDPGRGRGPADRLGLSVALCTLPWLGFVPDDVVAAPPAAVARLADQLGVDPGVLRTYGRRAKTRTEHLRLVAQYRGWRLPTSLEFKEFDEFLLARALEHDSPTLLFRLACEYLISVRVIRPGPVIVLERVARARTEAQRETYDRLAHEFTERRCSGLDGLLVVDPEIGMTRLRWLTTGPVEASPAGVKAEVGKLEFLRGLGADALDLSVLPAERRRFLATVGRRLTAQALARRDPQRRYPILLTLLAQSAVDVLDEVVGLFDQAVTARESKAERTMVRFAVMVVMYDNSHHHRLEELMQVIRVTTDLTVPDIEEARAFYADYLGLDGEDMGLDWVTRFVVPNSGEHIQLVSRDATAPENPLLTVKVVDVDDAYAAARRRGYEVVYPLTTEPWGIRRFFVRAPDGTVLNIAQHRDP